MSDSENLEISLDGDPQISSELDSVELLEDDEFQNSLLTALLEIRSSFNLWCVGKGLDNLPKLVSKAELVVKGHRVKKDGACSDLLVLLEEYKKATPEYVKLSTWCRRIMAYSLKTARELREGLAGRRLDLVKARASTYLDISGENGERLDYMATQIISCIDKLMAKIEEADRAQQSPADVCEDADEAAFDVDKGASARCGIKPSSTIDAQHGGTAMVETPVIRHAAVVRFVHVVTIANIVEDEMVCIIGIHGK